MHVALNAVHLVPGETGGLEIYARRLIPALEEVDPGLRLTVFAGPFAVRELEREGWRAELVPVHVDARSRARSVISEQLVLPRLVRKADADLLHNLMNTAPTRSPVPQVTTIHDLIYRTMPETHAGLLALGLRVLVPLAARRSARILAVSQATADDITRLLGISSEQIDVAPNGPGSPPGPAASEEDVRRSLELGDRRIVLAVSAKRPHKNLARLVEAMQSVDAVLVLPGYATPFEKGLMTQAERLGVPLRLTGWLDGPILEGLYRAADVFVLPSLSEGFGMPVLEAMARGTPVVCADIAPLREVAGDAALYFDPEDTDAIAAAIKRLIGEPALRDRLRTTGPQQAAKFSWAHAAEATLASYKRALEAGPTTS